MSKLKGAAASVRPQQAFNAENSINVDEMHKEALFVNFLIQVGLENCNPVIMQEVFRTGTEILNTYDDDKRQEFVDNLFQMGMESQNSFLIGFAGENGADIERFFEEDSQGFAQDRAAVLLDFAAKEGNGPAITALSEMKVDLTARSPSQLSSCGVVYQALMKK